MSLLEIKDRILDVFFPPRCVICGEVVSRKIPCACIKQLDIIQLPHGPIDFSRGERQHEYVNSAWACYEYAEPVKKMIARFKFEGETELSVPLGDMLYKRYESELLQGEFDFFVESPVSAQTRKERGYSQTELLAQQLSKKSQIPFLQNVLVKNRETEKQTSLSKKERLTNVQGAFVVSFPEQIQGKNICIVDDIITTGSTLQECAKTLHVAGARNIYAICVASTPEKN